MRWASWAVVTLLAGATSASVSSYNYVPQGTHQTLYTPGFEPIMHLDQVTFADTVYGQDHAYVVEFYAEWCGHCQAFAPFYRTFAQQVFGWRELVTVAAINCADPYNSDVCRQNGIDHYPILKYFARTARSADAAIAVDAQHSVDGVRDAVMRAVLNEYAFNRYADWPLFTHIQVDSRTTYGQLWAGVPNSAEYLAILFETTDGVGARFMLDMWERRATTGARRALHSSPLVGMLGIREFPTVALFRRDHQQALFMSRFTNGSFADLDRAIEADRYAHHLQPIAVPSTTMAPLTTTPPPPLIDCARFPERCRDMYYVSETDMLKAMREALYEEVIKTPNYVQGANFTNLYNFVDLLANLLRNSERARLVFTHLREWLESRKAYGAFHVDEWKRQFDVVERAYAFPFPTNASFQHCQGTLPALRGFTCGLWTTFHALTVHTYIDTIKDEHVDPLKPLRAIQGWVSSFFGCLECRNHFMEMTTQKFVLSERRVRHPHDMMTYLWRAHNIVNARLHREGREDPQFTKMQFPPPFLCPTCHSGGSFSRRQVRNFLLRYYGSIKPHNRITDRRLAF